MTAEYWHANVEGRVLFMAPDGRCVATLTVERDGNGDAWWRAEKDARRRRWPTLFDALATLKHDDLAAQT